MEVPVSEVPVEVPVSEFMAVKIPNHPLRIPPNLPHISASLRVAQVNPVQMCWVKHHVVTSATMGPFP